MKIKHENKFFDRKSEKIKTLYLPYVLVFVDDRGRTIVIEISDKILEIEESLRILIL